jgi:hypothetical protein
MGWEPNDVAKMGPGSVDDSAYRQRDSGIHDDRSDTQFSPRNRGNLCVYSG